MKKILYFLLPTVFVACKKEIIYRYKNDPSQKIYAILNKDTSLNGGIWDGHGRVLRADNKAIITNGILKNWIIDAPLTAQVFDTSVTLQNCVPYGDRFSTAWYGASPNRKDNWEYFMKSINTCLENKIWYCFTPAVGGREYICSKPLEIKSIYKGNYAFCSLRFGGEASMWDVGTGTILHYTGFSGSALNLQLNKGSQIDHIRFKGEWKSPGGTDAQYLAHTEATYQDVSGHHIGDWLYGITIDGNKPLDGKTTSGSTGITIEDVTIDGFTKLLALSPNGITANCDIIMIKNIHFGNGKYAFQGGQAQEKDIRIDGMFCWGSVYCLISIGHAGKYQAGDYAFSNGNIAGRVIRVVDISASGWFSTNITNFFVESIREIGVISTQVPITISKSTFDLSTSISKERIILWGSSPVLNDPSLIRISSSIIGYYDGSGTDVWVHGLITFEPGCSFRRGKLVYK